jgi:hypothetical protein
MWALLQSHTHTETRRVLFYYLFALFHWNTTLYIIISFLFHYILNFEVCFLHKQKWMIDHSFVLSKWVFRWEVKRSIWNSVTLETKISINLFNFERVVNRLRAWKLFLVSVSVLVQTKPKFRNFGLNIGFCRSLVVNRLSPWKLFW